MELTTIAQNEDKETAIESIIMAKGISECMAYITSDSVNVVVKTSGLDKTQVAQIKDAVQNETKLGADKIKIVEVK